MALPFVAALALFGMSGCGGGGGSVFDDNTRAEVSLESPDVEDLRLIVSPDDGSPNSGDACIDDDPGFGCDSNLENDRTRIAFDVNDQFANEPYNVFVRNVSNSTRTAFVEIFLNGGLRYDLEFDVQPGQTVFVARVFNDGVDDTGTFAKQGAKATAKK